MNKSALNSVYLKGVNWYRAHYTLKSLRPCLTDASLVELMRSKHFVVVNKPYDLIVYDFKRRHFRVESAYELLKDKYPVHYDPRLTGGFHVLHRLDYDTSGCLCVPLNLFSQQIATRAFSEGRVQKHYLALVHGHLTHQPASPQIAVVSNADCNSTSSNSSSAGVVGGEFTVNVPIGDDARNMNYQRCTSHDRQGNAHGHCVRAENAITGITVLEYGTYKGRDCTKLLMRASTGRRHQLRVHCAHLGHPIVGDLRYGLDDDYSVYRTMLHAYRLNMRVETAQRQFVKAKAADPFLNSVDDDWVPHTVVSKLTI